MIRRRSLPLSRQAEEGPLKGEERKHRRPDRNRDSDWDKMTHKLLTHTGHFRKP